MQTDVLISKQKQAIDQTFSNTIMLNTLAALENLVRYYGYDGTQIFDYYSGDAKNEQQLINAVYLQLNIFRASHLSYQQVYPEYHFPNNLSFEQINNIIDQWEQVITNNNLKKLYREFKNYISGHSETSGIKKEIKKIGNSPITKKDLYLISHATPYVNNNMFESIRKIISFFQSKNDKDYKFDAVLNGKKMNNQIMNNLRNVEKQIKKNIEKIGKSLKDIDNHLEKLFKNILNNIQIQQSEKIHLDYLIVHFYEQFIEIKESVDVSNYKNQYNILKNEILKCGNNNEDINFIIEKINQVIDCLDGKEPPSKYL